MLHPDVSDCIDISSSFTYESACFFLTKDTFAVLIFALLQAYPYSFGGFVLSNWFLGELGPRYPGMFGAILVPARVREKADDSTRPPSA